MNTWSPIWSGIVDSSVWDEPSHVLKLFIGMLSIKDYDHMVRLDSYKLSRRLHMEHSEVLDGLKVLSGPDLRRPGQKFEGRRIQAVDDGWLIINGEFYVNEMRRAMKRARDRKAQAAKRERDKQAKEPYTAKMGSTLDERIKIQNGQC